MSRSLPPALVQQLEQLPSPQGDWVLAQSFLEPSQGMLAKSLLESFEFAVSVEGAQLAQTNIPWALTTGGVRVMVQQSQLLLAQSILSAWSRGELGADDDGEAPLVSAPANDRPPVPLFSPDWAALLSLPLSPLYGGLLHWLNARALGDRQLQRESTLALCVIAALLAFLYRPAIWPEPNPGQMLRANLGALFVTGAWYLLVGQRHSKVLVARYRLSLARRAQSPWALLAFVLWQLFAYAAGRFD